MPVRGVIDPKEVPGIMRRLAGIAARADDPEGLDQLGQMVSYLTAEYHSRTDSLRDDGYSWADLARPSGRSRQALAQAHRRYQVTHPGHRVRHRRP